MVKEKISIAVDKDLLKWLDEKIKIKIFASRSHAFERALTELQKRLKENK